MSRHKAFRNELKNQVRDEKMEEVTNEVFNILHKGKNDNSSIPDSRLMGKEIVIFTKITEMLFFIIQKTEGIHLARKCGQKERGECNRMLAMRNLIKVL